MDMARTNPIPIQNNGTATTTLIPIKVGSNGSRRRKSIVYKTSKNGEMCSKIGGEGEV